MEFVETALSAAAADVAKHRSFSSKKFSLAWVGPNDVNPSFSSSPALFPSLIICYSSLPFSSSAILCIKDTKYKGLDIIISSFILCVKDKKYKVLDIIITVGFYPLHPFLTNL